MDLQLEGKKALVTGSTAGIGFATARALAAEGASVVVNGRTQERVDAAIAEIRKQHPGAKLSGVVERRLDCGRLRESHSGAAGSGCARQQHGNLQADSIRKNTGRRLDAHFRGERDERSAALAPLSARNAREKLGSHFICLQRIRGADSRGDDSLRNVEDGASGRCAGIAETVAGTGITVNSVLVGPTRSEGVNTFIAQMGGGADPVKFEAEFFKSVRPSSLIKRFETVDEVANMIVYLSSTRASGTTGSAIRVDGGVVRAIL